MVDVSQIILLYCTDVADLSKLLDWRCSGFFKAEGSLKEGSMVIEYTLVLRLALLNRCAFCSLFQLPANPILPLDKKYKKIKYVFLFASQ